jgi:hypothetical protein
MACKSSHTGNRRSRGYPKVRKIGAPLSPRRPELAGLRKWHVHGFDNVLIFYFPCDDGVSIVRVLQAARDGSRAATRQENVSSNSKFCDMMRSAGPAYS